MNLLNNLLMNTYSGDYTKIISVITKFLKANSNAKIITQNISKKKSNIIAIFGKPELLINCHMDTVPPSGKWKHDPCKLNVSSGNAYGLGTADTKGNIYAVLKTVAKVKPKNLMLLFSIDEEAGKIDSGVTHFLKSKYKKGIKYAIVCEPTSLKFVNKHKGYYSYTINVKSKPKHSSEKQKSSKKYYNAITKAADLILKFDNYGFNIGKISGGVQGNVIAENCEFKISIRTYKPPKEILKDIKKIVKDTPKVKIKLNFIGKPLDHENKPLPFVKSKCSEVNFWTEASLFNYSNIDAIAFGCGNIKQAHTNNEFIKINELEKTQKIFEKILGEF